MENIIIPDEPVVVQPTTQEKINTAKSKMLDIVSRIKSTDYLVLKEVDGCDMSKYGNYKATRHMLRDEYNKLEGEVEMLELQLKDEILNSTSNEETKRTN